MPTVPLPGFAGVSFFSAVVQQQRRASGCLLPVPAIELLATAADKDVEGLDDSCTSSSQLYTSSPHDWVQQVVQLTQDLGFVPQPISTVAAAAPMSKAEKSLNKQSRKGLWQQMQPTAKQANTATGAGAGPALAQFTAQYVSSFSDSATTSSNNKKVDQAAVHMTGLSLMLNEPVIPKANTVWGKEAHVQGPTVMLCEPGELQQLRQEVPEDLDPESWDVAFTRVCQLPLKAPAATDAVACSSQPTSTVAAAAGGSTPPTAAAPAVVPSTKQLVQAWVLQQHQAQHNRPTAAVVAPAAVSAEDTQPAATQPAEGTAEDSPTGTAEAARAAQQQEPQPASSDAAACAAQHTPSVDAAGPAAGHVMPGTPARNTAHQVGISRLQGTALDEPALPIAWLQVQQSAAGASPAAASHCPVSSIKIFQDTAAAEQADYYIGSILAAATNASTTSTGLLSTAADITCLQLPIQLDRAHGADAAGTVHAHAAPQQLQAQQQQHLLLPASAVPTALRMPSAPSTRSSSQEQPDKRTGAAASKPQPQQQSTANILLGWMATISNPKGRKQATAGNAEAHVKERQSVAATRTARNTPRVSMQYSAAETGAAAKGGQAPSAAAPNAGPAEAAAAVNTPAAPVDAAAPGLAAAAATMQAVAHQQEQAQQQQQQQQQQGRQQSGQAAVDSQAGAPETQDDSCCGELSPGSLLIEVPVCMLEQPSEPLNAQYCRAALSAAQAGLDMTPDLFDPAAAHESAAGDIGEGTLVWDASWGELGTPVGGADCGAGAVRAPAAAVSAWCTPAVLDMLTGAALQATAAGDPGAADKQLAGSSGPSSGHVTQQQGEAALLGASLLEQMVAADMQLGDHDSSLLLPVVLFPDSDDCWYSAALASSSTASAGTSICVDLRMQCGYKRQSTAHLELYFDWSLLQPRQQQYYSSSGMKRNSSCLFGAAGVKRRKSVAGPAAPTLGPQLQAKLQMQPKDADAWLQMVLSHPGLKQLQQDVSKRQAALAQAPVAAAAEGVVQLSQALSRQVFAAYLQQVDEPHSVYHPPVHAALHVPTANPSTHMRSVTEVVPPEVAAAAAAWHQACDQSKAAAAAAAAHHSAAAAPGAAGQGMPAALGAPASATVAAAAGAPSDLDFFMQLQGTQAQRGKRQHSLLAPKGTAAAGMGAAAEHVDDQQGDSADAAVPAVQAVSLSPAEEAPAKRARVASMQQLQQQQHAQDGSDARAANSHGQERSRQQQQQDAALATADLALNGVLRDATAQQVAAAAAAAAAGIYVGPTVQVFKVPGPILKLLLQLDGTRRSALSAMQFPGPDLVESLLWQDSAAQQQLLRLKALQHKQKQETGQGPSAHQRQHNKQLVVLVLLSQTAACLLHYGVQVAHMFLQHGLQRLPSILDACRPALAALSAASDALGHQPAAPAAGTVSSSGVGGEHPKLAHLRDLVLQLKSCQRDCKLLLVAEGKAFFNLYHALSAAGIIAVQLDRDRKLPMAVPDAAAAGVGGSTNRAADLAVQAAWAAGVQSALSAASCVLATHEQLHHPCMALQGFHVLIEYVAWEDTSTGAAAAGTARALVTDSSKAAVSSHFGPGKHFVFAVEEPNLAQAALEAEDANVHAAAGATSTAGTAAACRTPAVHASQHHPVHGPSAAAPAAAAQGAAAAAAAATAAVAETVADAGQEVPLVLNVSPGGLIKRRQSLYHSLMQLEAQGYVLVERPLGGSSRAGEAAGGAAALVAMAVDIVLTPRACLCIWDESKLPKEPKLAMQALSRALLALSISYDCVFFLFELEDGLLQPILRSSTNLQGLARAAAVKLQLLTCFSAANTQDAVLHICKEATSTFWTLNPTDGNAGSTGLQPPLGLSDLPTAAEAQLAACLALNPLSAAVLASHGANLSALFELVMSDEGQQHALLQALLPARSLQLLQVQASAVAERIQQQRQQEQDELLQQSPGGQQHQQQGPGQQAAYQGAPQAQQQQQQYMADAPDARNQYGSSYQHPARFDAQQSADQQQYGDTDAGMWAAPGAQQYSQQYSGMPAQQSPWQQQPHAPGQMPGGPAGRCMDPMQDQEMHMPHSEAWQDAGQYQHMQQDPWADSPGTGPRAVHRGQQEMQHRQQHGARAGPEYMPATGFDPSAVLDDFLSSRSPAGAAPAGNQGAGYGRPTGMAAGRPGMPTGSYKALHQQHSRAGQMNRGQGQSAAPGRHQQQWAGAVGGAYAPQPQRPVRQAGMRRGPDAVYSPAPWAAADDDAAGLDRFGVAASSADFLQVTHEDAFADAGEGAEPWEQLDAGPGFDLGGMQGGWQGQQRSRQVHGRGGRMPMRQAEEVPAQQFEPMFKDEGDLFDQQRAMNVRRAGRQQQGQAGAYVTERGLPQRGASRGGMFAATPDNMQGFEDDGYLFGSEPASRQAPGARHTAAAAAAGAGMQARRPHPMAGGAAGYCGRGQTGHRGFGGPSSSNTSGLSVPAFMPHHNPSKQLKYRMPAAAGGGVKRKKGGEGGLQTKLCWG